MTTAQTAAALDAPLLPVADLSDEALSRLTVSLAETAARYDASGEFPWQPLEILNAGGYLHVTVGRDFGGSPVSETDRVRLLLALGEGDPSVALLVAMTLGIHASQDAQRTWPDDLYRSLLAESVERATILNAIRAEPEWGAPARGGLPATTVRRRGDEWVLDGRKAHATGVEGLRYHLVWAVTDVTDPETVEAVGDEPLVAHAIVDGHAEGIEVIRTWDHLGQRATGTHDVVYDGVRIPASHFTGTPPAPGGVGAPPRGAKVRPGGFGLQIPALYLGVAKAAQEFHLGFANTRVPSSLGRPLASLDRVRAIAGEIEAQIALAEETLLGIAARLDAGQDVGRRIGIAKLIVTRAAVSAVQTAVESLGNAALTRHNPLERHLRNVLPSRVHPPQDDAALVGTGRALLDEWAAGHPDAGSSLSGRRAANA